MKVEIIDCLYGLTPYIGHFGTILRLFRSAGAWIRLDNGFQGYFNKGEYKEVEE
jgi:hypothetical protein